MNPGPEGLNEHLKRFGDECVEKSGIYCLRPVSSSILLRYFRPCLLTPHETG
jgi:hypothetical protein